MGAVFSYNVSVPIVINLDEPAYCPKNSYVVFPKNTRLLAWGNVLKSDNRVNMNVYRAILPTPSGKEIEIEGLVLYPDGTAGVPGERKEYKDARYMSSAAVGALQGVGQAVSASANVSPIASGAASSVIQTGSGDIGQMTAQKVDVSISIPPQQKVTVFLLNRIVFDKGEHPLINKRGKNGETDDDSNNQ
jgi:hypothetical protein